MNQRSKSSPKKKNDFLTTGEDLNPLRLLESFGNEVAVLVVLAAVPSHGHTGERDTQGEWILDTWRRSLESFPEMVGCRLLWNTIFFACRRPGLEDVKDRLRTLLQASHRPGINGLSILCVAEGSAAQKLSLLDDMLGELSAKRNFGTDRRLSHRLVDGADWNEEPLPE